MTSIHSLLRRIRGNALAAAALLLAALCAAPAALHAANYTVNALTDTKPEAGGAGSGMAGDLQPAPHTPPTLRPSFQRSPAAPKPAITAPPSSTR